MDERSVSRARPARRRAIANEPKLAQLRAYLRILCWCAWSHDSDAACAGGLRTTFGRLSRRWNGSPPTAELRSRYDATTIVVPPDIWSISPYGCHERGRRGRARDRREGFVFPTDRRCERSGAGESLDFLIGWMTAPAPTAVAAALKDKLVCIGARAANLRDGLSYEKYLELPHVNTTSG